MDFLTKLIQAIVAYFTQQKTPTIPFEPTQPTLISETQLEQIYGCAPDLARLYAPHLNMAMLRYQIDTPLRIAHFLAQVGHESGRLRFVREIWGPTPAQKRYEGRKDLGNVQPGDGVRFLGRGLIQLTGRSNYDQMRTALGVDVVTRPEKVESPDLAAMSAAWFWNSRGLNAHADNDDLLTITKRINGGTNGLEDRRALLSKAKKVLVL